MKCPICTQELVPVDRQGIEIDCCPQCRGVWLDRNELDKIVERSVALYSQGDRGEHLERHHDRPPAQHHGEQHNHRPHPKHRKKSFLEEIFDFD